MEAGQEKEMVKHRRRHTPKGDWATDASMVKNLTGSSDSGGRDLSGGPKPGARRQMTGGLDSKKPSKKIEKNEVHRCGGQLYLQGIGDSGRLG